MSYLSDSCLLSGFPASVAKAAQQAGMSFPLSLQDFVANDHCPHARCLTLHLKSLFAPDSHVDLMLASMRTVYETADIGVRVGSREDLTGPAFALLVDLDIVANCPTGSTTAEQQQLFGNRNVAGADDVVIYFVRQTFPGMNGCAAHPASQPGAVVTRIASRWTVAHETAHVLGVPHISGEKNATGNCVTPDYSRLMTGCGTSNITGTPTIDTTETSTMTTSSYTHNCPR